MKTIRCAIYTRKSSEEGLEQAFNSLDAQREACAAYILSQASEAWVALPDIYDDGGLSGGSLERPALQRLLREVAESRVDIIVVYKVDRLMFLKGDVFADNARNCLALGSGLLAHFDLSFWVH